MDRTTTVPIVSIVDDMLEPAFALQAAVHSIGLAADVFESASRLLDSTNSCRAGCIVISSKLPHCGGFAPYEQLLTHPGHTPLILRCGKSEVPTIVHAISMGAIEVVDAQIEVDALVPLIARAVEQDARAREHDQRFQDFQGRFSQLSSEELVVFGLVAAGKLNKQIESLLGVKRRTVEDRRARVMRKLKVKTVPELVEFAVHLGL